MNQSLSFALLILLAVVLITPSCSKKTIKIEPTVTALTDYQSGNGVISVSLSGGKQPYSLQWSNGETDTVISNLEAGDYTLTVTDKRGRKAIDTITVTQPPWPVCVDAQGNSYRTVVVNTKIWMAENLRTTQLVDSVNVVAVSVENNDSLDAQYGKLYTWPAAMNGAVVEMAKGVCPDGWHIPSDAEWMELIDNVSNHDNVIPNLAETLNLSYAGFYNGEFQSKDVSVSFWSSTPVGDNAWKQYFNKNLSKAFRYHEKKNNAISVRCIKDQPLP